MLEWYSFMADLSQPDFGGGGGGGPRLVTRYFDRLTAWVNVIWCFRMVCKAKMISTMIIVAPYPISQDSFPQQALFSHTNRSGTDEQMLSCLGDTSVSIGLDLRRITRALICK